MPHFGERSLEHRTQLHSLLQKVVDAAIKEIDFMILDAQRGRAEQERAVAQGFSTVHFGNSAHNYAPAIAMDLFPAPYDWHNAQSFIVLGRDHIMPIAKKLGIPIRWGADFNKDGVLMNNHFNDAPHYELDPWRNYAKRLIAD